MARVSTSVWFTVSVLAICAQSGIAIEADPDGCAHFTWDVSHELAVMKQTPQPITAATRPGGHVPRIELDQLYEVKLSPQAAVTYAAKPAKLTSSDGDQGGLIRFPVEKAALYRISISSRHWIDVVDRGQLLKSKDFQGSRGCERPHKIVEFELPARKYLTLQISGSSDPAVLVAVTPASARPRASQISRDGQASAAPCEAPRVSGAPWYGYRSSAGPARWITKPGRSSAGS